MPIFNEVNDAVAAHPDVQRRALWIYIRAHLEMELDDDLGALLDAWHRRFKECPVSIKQVRRLITREGILDVATFKSLRAESKELGFLKVDGYDALLKKTMRKRDGKRKRKKRIIETIEESTGGGEFQKIEKI